jgi:hypothetical protein
MKLLSIVKHLYIYKNPIESSFSCLILTKINMLCHKAFKVLAGVLTAAIRMIHTYNQPSFVGT